MFWNAVNQTTSAQDLLDFFGDAIVSHSSTSISHFNRFYLQAAQWLVDGDVLVLDNAQTHHEIEQDLRALLREAGITLLFLPKYSPEFNPIELVWSKSNTPFEIWEKEHKKRLLLL